MKVLLVNDEMQTMKGVSQFIENEDERWELETANSGEEALQKLSCDRFDAVVSELDIPGMGGPELLKKVEVDYPAVRRVVLSDRTDRAAALRVVKPMHQHIAKPCEAETLIDTIKRGEILQETIRSAEALDAIERANCMPTLPEVVNEINHEIESENGNAKSIAGIVTRDVLLSARVLQLANSPIFGSRNPVKEITRAVSLVGLDMIRSMAMLHAVYSENQDNDHILSTRQLMDQGFRVALIAKKLAGQQSNDQADGNAVFTAGLMHDVGKLILLNAFPEDYHCILRESKESGVAMHQLEMEAFGATHQGVGGYLFSLWGLPNSIVESVAAHHSFENCSLSEGNPRQFVFAASWISDSRDDVELVEMIDRCNDQAAAVYFAQRVIEWRRKHSA